MRAVPSTQQAPPTPRALDFRREGRKLVFRGLQVRARTDTQTPSSPAAEIPLSLKRGGIHRSGGGAVPSPHHPLPAQLCPPCSIWPSPTQLERPQVNLTSSNPCSPRLPTQRCLPPATDPGRTAHPSEPQCPHLPRGNRNPAPRGVERVKEDIKPCLAHIRVFTRRTSRGGTPSHNPPVWASVSPTQRLTPGPTGLRPLHWLFPRPPELP